MDKEQQNALLNLAEKTIRLGCEGLKEPAISNQLTTGLGSPFTELQATFVSLHKYGELRGCIGSLEAQRSLANDIIYNAYAAAFHDHRFTPVDTTELDELEIEISVLTVPEPISADSEQELLNQLVPNIDGLIIDDNHGHRATFLPQVWEQLPAPEEFLNHLKRKAGLSGDLWPEGMQCYRYHCLAFNNRREG
ncbi:AmmeMemoRadiSam system protein A [Parendozoicomonas haliclonae]|uniref:AMMECR1 domain-containing protein n=1 Tax=Parendozoicomonas haliclonae TaxID=1960125 RepID=A0A1X7API6_9GAMM|nr:AmmeMemoRadiSam system protein A [Parendozoicomonas haliclonae]SMA49999.1 hypothetical protein EHSB41UT_03790 [Parendozoicomonas haliclonae]